jgi:hypothetical protein
MNTPTTHGDKLKVLLTNNKLPASDKKKFVMQLRNITYGEAHCCN